jgi:hypothetical protein
MAQRNQPKIKKSLTSKKDPKATEKSTKATKKIASTLSKNKGKAKEIQHGVVGFDTLLSEPEEEEEEVGEGEGNEEYDDEHDEHDEEEEAQAQGEETRKRRKWSNIEDRQLCTTWANVGRDAIVGTEQNLKSYWENITDNFNVKMENRIELHNKKHKKAVAMQVEFLERSLSSVKGRWTHIQKQTLRFVKLYEDAGELESGHSHDEVVILNCN